MHRHRSAHPLPLAVTALVLAAPLLVGLLVSLGQGHRPHVAASPGLDAAVAQAAPGAVHRRARRAAITTVADTTTTDWSGYAFDTCRAPSQRAMDRWLQHSPFVGVGVYLGGVQRACDQTNLTAGWVRRQTAAGWKLLPLWVGPQAACTGYDHRIDGRPGADQRFASARAEGAREGVRAAATARSLGLARGQLVFYDLEGFDTSRRPCVRSSLAFLEAWTTQLHREGYESGVYSHVNAGIKVLAATPRSYLRPDAVWYAWVERANARPTQYVSDPGFMRTQRVHQFALDERARFGGIGLDIDWNYVSFGSPSGAMPLLKVGARGAAVRRLQQQLNGVLTRQVPVDGSFGPATARAVKRYQASVGQARTSIVTARTWASFSATQPRPARAAKHVVRHPVRHAVRHAVKRRHHARAKGHRRHRALSHRAHRPERRH